MAKHKSASQTSPQHVQGTLTYQHQRGVIKDNAIHALLHDKLFRQRVERNKKGKGVINVKQNISFVGAKSPIIRFL